MNNSILQIKNGSVFTDLGTIEKRDVSIRNGRIESVRMPDSDAAHLSGDNRKDVNPDDDNSKIQCDGPRIINAEGLYVIPGLMDIHLHGCCGADFCDGTAESLKTIAEYELSNGITAICPASMTLKESELSKIFQTAADFNDPDGADIVGINMEGPFISREKCAAQNPEYIIPPSADMFYRLKEAAGGLIKLIDIAPETEGAIDFIDRVSGDVHVSLAHSACDYDTAMEAFRHGADHVTHLYNGMNSFGHRNPGILGAACDHDGAYVELIADGIHSAPASVRMAFKLMGPDRMVLISDSMEACGMPDGNYRLGGQNVQKKGSRAYLTGTDTLAGSVLNLMDILRLCVREFGIPFETAVKAATINPARSIGVQDDYGSIAAGKKADMVILDSELNIVTVIKDGREYKNHNSGNNVRIL